MASFSQQPSGRLCQLFKIRAAQLYSFLPLAITTRPEKGTRDNQSYLCAHGCRCPEGRSDWKRRGVWPGGEQVGLHVTGAQGTTGPRPDCLWPSVCSFVYSLTHSLHKPIPIYWAPRVRGKQQETRNLPSGSRGGRCCSVMDKLR